jgi:hypothetical protein
MPRDIVVDSGPLKTYVALCYLDRTNARKAHRDSVFRELRGGGTFADSQQARLRQALGKSVITTPHVLVEIFKFREHLSLRQEKEQLRACCLDLISSGKIEEASCPTAELARDESFRQMACRLGIADAGLVFVAANKNALLLTDDRRLFQVCSAGATYEIRLLDEYLRD